jgi:RNA polymerase sigma-70 factor (ECF subfamily)
MGVGDTDLEREVRSHCAASRWGEAAALLLRGYGRELYGFLVVANRGDDAEAAEAFSELTEALWRNLPTFGWHASARTWAYAIARKLTLTRRRDAARRRRRAVDLAPSELERIAASVRTETARFLRTDKRTRLQALRDALSEGDRLLLLLRVDRGLEWAEVARVLHEDEHGELDEAALARETARLRKRYQIVKERLRELAKAEGLLD